MWFLNKEYLKRVESCSDKVINASAEQIKAFSEIYGPQAAANATGFPRITTVSGDQAQINVSGVLLKQPDFILWWFGIAQTIYSDITKSLALVASNPEIKKVTMVFDSPGGSIAGMFSAMKDIREFSKPITAVVDEMAASAAFGLASQADEILASGKSASVGSVGVAVEIPINENRVSITSTEAPNKRPDVTTEAGQAVIRKGLDDIHELFASDIAKGRGTTVANVNKNFGQGAMVLANEAKNKGMIDGFIDSDDSQSEGSNTNTAMAVSVDATFEVNDMTKEELKASHPKLYAEIYGEGVKAERDRVSAHLTLGESCGAMEKAVASIKAGSDLTQLDTAEYIAASVKTKQVADRTADADVGNPGTPETPGAENSDDAVFAKALKLVGGDDE